MTQEFGFAAANDRETEAGEIWAVFFCLIADGKPEVVVKIAVKPSEIIVRGKIHGGLIANTTVLPTVD